MSKSVFERARAYVAKMPEAVSGQGGHDATFAVAVALVKGFSLPVGEAAQLLAEYSARCRPPWRESELAHKLRQAQSAQRADGYLLKDGEWRPTDRAAVAYVAPQAVEYDEEALRRMAGDLRVDAVWLANRSQLDPSQMDSGDFLRAMFRQGERVIVLADDMSQGTVWPDEALPVAGPRGMWFLAQPVDGEMRMNPRSGKLSRRSEESVTTWRYVLLESDEAPAGLWLSALAQMRLPIAAIYSSGGRSVHALVKVDAGSKREWDARVRSMKAWLPAAGADARAMTAVRLSRLPGQPRAEKNGWQRLLYVNSYPLAECLTNMPVLRDVERHWCAEAREGYVAGDVERMRRALTGLEHYGRVRSALASAAEDLRAGLVEYEAVAL